MSTAPTPPAETTQPKRVKKRIYIPLILLVLLILVAIGFFVRGTWAESAERNPAGPDAGTVTQLLRKDSGNVVVRCAVVVDATPKETWAVVSNYRTHHKFVPHITHAAETMQPDGKLLVEGTAHSSVWGDWPFETLVTHEKHEADGIYRASWSHEDKPPYKINRGSWDVKPFDAAKKQTLLEFTIQIEFEQHPNFIVRNIIMDRVHRILKAMRDETLAQKSGAPAPKH